MMTPGSHADTETMPSAGAADAFDIAPLPRGRKALREALHRDFDDVRDLPAGGGTQSAVGGAWSATLPEGADSEAPRRRPWTPLEWVLVAAGVLLVAQVPLLWAFSEASEGQGPAVHTCLDLQTARRATIPMRERIALELRCNPNVRSVETFLTADPASDKLPEDAQVVEVDMPEAVDPEPVETKYVADKTTRTEKETRAEASARSDERPPRGVNAPAKAPPKEPVDSGQSPEPTKAPPEAAPSEDEPTVAKGDPDKAPGSEAPQVADIVENVKGDKGTVAEKKVMERGQGGGGARILMPATSERNVLANLQALQGDFASTDHLPDVERGKHTVLNANSYKYADFFHGVKRAVERQWRPSDVYLRRDPTGQVYGVKDRYTVLRIVLDRTGALESVIITRPSGLDFMDEEAKRAFREAAPFPNPPLGLVDPDGMIRFEFGFFFEITGGKYRFNWRRL